MAGSRHRSLKLSFIRKALFLALNVSDCPLRSLYLTRSLLKTEKKWEYNRR